ncbi:nucleoside triphosphate pyrophosphohydrolase [Ahrensia marina]|uniref:Nucleoside triphosphate pyrophosphohydrolase n=1 Tax=Ahrensia marina TaxID=1514904 RepID=A0A0M9GMP0_9HYPH|nr:nucleoside triphosphate pyrophosphohydrolase [Ahrensia marina]KPB01360.1 nucleoside triphosphate hydrolase [Ahrensia marina]
MEPSNDIKRLVDIMARLRDPQNGCAWDVEQTFETIMPYTIEEAYEVADAIERGDMDDLADELGDLLLQVVYHARMAEEAGLFAFGDVVHAVTDKMIRRHPHVFGPDNTRSMTMAKGMWEKVKAQEKADKAKRQLEAGTISKRPSLLDDVPRAQPSLMRSLKLQKKAATVGFDWSEAEPILDKIHEEIGELSEAMQSGDEKHITEEYGDLLFVMVNLGRHLGIEAEAALAGTNLKFSRRFAFIEEKLDQAGKSIKDASLDEMEALWQLAKTELKPL